MKYSTMKESIELDIPRRNRLDLNTPAELAIINAINEVEKAGAHERLTEISILLLKCKNMLGDFIDKKFIEISRDQKLLAIKLKYYDNLEWTPKKGDYYTSCRNDLELYQIVDEDENFFMTNYCNPQQTTPNPAQWPKTDFKKGFGEKRIWVPDWILQ